MDILRPIKGKKKLYIPSEFKKSNLLQMKVLFILKCNLWQRVSFTQKEGLEYKNPFNPIVKFDYIKIILSIVVVENMDIMNSLMCAPHFYIVKVMKIFQISCSILLMKNIPPKFFNWSKRFTNLSNLHKFKTATKLHVKIDKIAHIINEMKGMFNITKGHLEIYVGLHITRDIFIKTIHIHHQ